MVGNQEASADRSHHIPERKELFFLMARRAIRTKTLSIMSRSKAYSNGVGCG